MNFPKTGFAFLIVLCIIGAAIFSWLERRAAPGSPASDQPRLAPEGILYVVEAISLTSDDGIFKVIEGAEVEVLEQQGEIITVSYQGKEIAADEYHFSNCMDTRDAILAAHAENSRRLHEKFDQDKERVREFERQILQSTKEYHKERLTERIARFEKSLAAIERNLLHDSDRPRPKVFGLFTRSTIRRSPAEIEKLQQERNRLRARISAMQKQRNAIR